MKAEKISASDYVDVFYKETVRAGKQVVLPFARSKPIFSYNKDAWAKAGLPDRGPKTWDEFNNDFAPKLKPLAPVVHALGGAASYSAWVFQGVDWAYGGSYSDPDFTMRIQEPNSVTARESGGSPRRRHPALRGRELKPFLEPHPHLKTPAAQLPKPRPQDSARERVPNGDAIIGKGLERIPPNGEPAEGVFKDVADQLNTEKQPVLRALKDLGEA